MQPLLPPDPSHKPKRLLPKLLKGAGLGIGVAAIAGTTGALWWGWNFIQSDLAPMIQRDLEARINRPLKLGSLDSITWGKVTFGQSELPSFVKTINGQSERDQDRASVESVEVRFNPIQAITTRTLTVDITLNQPKVFLDEAPDSDWIDIRLSASDGRGLIKTEINSIAVQNGTVQLAPRRTAQRTLSNLNGTLNIRPEKHRVDLQGQATVDSGGTINLKGRVLTKNQTLQLETKSQDLNLPPLVGILPADLPFEVKAAKLSGDVDITYRHNQPLLVESNSSVKALDIYVPAEDVKIKAEQFQGKIQLDIHPRVPVELRGEGRIKNGAGSVPEDAILSTGRSRRQVAQNVNGTVKFLGQKQRFWSDLTATLPEGGDLKITGITSFLEQRSNLNIRANKVPAPLLDQAFKIPLNVRSGVVNGNITLNLQKGDRPSVQGLAQLQDVEAQIIGLPQSFKNTRGWVRLKGLTATLENVTADYGNIPIIGNGSIDPDRGYDLRGQSNSIEVNSGLQTLGVGKLPFPISGSVIAEGVTVTGRIDDPILQGQIRSTQALTLDQVPVKQASATFRLQQPTLAITDIQATPKVGGAVQGSALYNLSGTEPWTASFDAQQIPGNAFVRHYNADPGFELGNVASQVELEVLGDRYQLEMDLQAPEGEFPASGSLTAVPDKINLRNIQAQVPGGELLANGSVINGRVSLKTKIPGINLIEYSEELRGQLTGELDIQAPLAGFSSQTAIAQGQVTLTKGISLIEDPIQAQVRWNGEQIMIPKAMAPGFFAQGTMGAILQGDTAPQLTTLDLAIQQQNYALSSLPFELPANSRLSGRADLTGQLSGQVYAPSLKGTLNLRSLRVNDLPFEPLLAGSLNYSADQGLAIQTRGSQDQVNLSLNAKQEPVSFLVKNQEALAMGDTIAPNRLAVDIQQIPLTALNWDIVNDYGYGRVTGEASGNFEVTLPTYEISGPLLVTQPAVGPFKGDRFTGQLQIQNGTIGFSEGELTQQKNHFLIDAQLIPDTNPRVSGKLTIANAQVEDAIVALETLNFIAPKTGVPPDYGTAKTLDTEPVGQPQAPLILQLQRLAEIKALKQQQQEIQAGLTQIPSWTALTGAMRGQIAFNGSAQTGINADFNLNSQQLQWASIPLDNVLASGLYHNNELQFKQLSVNSNGGKLAFQGKLGQKNDGSLQITKLPLGQLSQLLDLTFPLEGYLDAQAQLAGSFDNPALEGKISLSETTVDQTQIQTAQAQFDFKQARLEVAGLIDINTPDPVRFEGSIPYAFPFMTTQPASDVLDIKLQVKDEGLTLLNLLTDQLAWVEGNGEVDIAISGTFNRPSIRGRVNIQDATIDSLSLPGPLTQVTGELDFNQERVQVSTLQGSFSEGKLSASGILPIFDQGLLRGNIDSTRDRIIVSLDDLALNLKGLYRGGVDGDLQITGSILSPNVGGMVALNNGQIVLSEATALSEGTSDEPASRIFIDNQAPLNGNQPLQFNDLIVRLEDKVKILQPPLLSFSTEGQLTVNGSIDSPRPEGKVSFTEGEVNLFTSIFRLNQQEENFAEFFPRTGLDPYLKVNLTTTVSEVNTGRNNRLSEFEDPIAGTLGSIESVRVQAAVDGHASKLLTELEQAIELTSNPNRSEGEILALLSGGVAEAIQGGSTDLALANIASSAVLNRVQGYVDNAFGGRAVFRLFPILIPNETERSVLAFGGELGYDVTDNLSVSVLQVLTGTDDPTRFNVSYDINEEFRARSSISVEGEATGLLEYRFRF